MNRSDSQVTEKILDIALEIISLLTGEDYVVVKKCEDQKCGPHAAGGCCRHQGSGLSLLPDLLIHKIKEQKILALTNAIIQLLTGEACEYLQGHKDLTMEIHQRRNSLVDTSVPSGCPALAILSVRTTGEGVTQTSKKSLECEKARKSDRKSKKYSSHESPSWDEEPFPDTDTEYTPKEYTSTSIKEASDECDEDNLTNADSSPSAEEICKVLVKEESMCDEDPANVAVDTDDMCNVIKEESIYCEEDLTDTETYSPSEHTRRQSLSTGVKEEKTKRGEQRASDSTVCTHTKYTQTDLGKATFSESDLAMYEMYFRGERPFKCSECGKGFSQMSNLVKHRRTHSGERPYKCPECGKCFSMAAKLATHERIHKGEKPFKCSDCDKCYNLKHDLIRHQRVHTGDKPFKCIECEKSYTRSEQLASHKRIHTGDKPFKCQECGKCFNLKCNLIRHQKIHTGERPFKCDECEKCYKRAADLVSHKWIHTGEKPFKCNECGKSYIWATDLASHKKVHTGEKPPSECP